MKRKIYVQPAMSVIVVETSLLMAASTIDVTVRGSEYNGEGRTKDHGEWDIWDEE
jgi:hypothetical protein